MLAISFFRKLMQLNDPNYQPRQFGIPAGSLEPSLEADLQQKLNELNQYIADGVKPWTMFQDKNQFRCSILEDNSHWMTYKCDGEINVPFEYLVEHLNDMNFMKKIEKAIKHAEFLKNYGESSRIVRLELSMPFPFDNREYFLFDTTYYTSKDEFIHVNYDSKDPDIVRPTKGLVLAHSELMGTIVRRTSPTSCRYIEFGRTDVNMKHAPQFVLKSQTKEIAQKGLKIKKEIEKMYATPIKR